MSTQAEMFYALQICPLEIRPGVQIRPTGEGMLTKVISDAIGGRYFTNLPYMEYNTKLLVDIQSAFGVGACKLLNVLSGASSEFMDHWSDRPKDLEYEDKMAEYMNFAAFRYICENAMKVP
jgi:hypothetical protein